MKTFSSRIKSLLFISLLLTTFQLFAADYSAMGKNRLGQTVFLSEGSSGLEISVYVKVNNSPDWNAIYKKKPIESYLFKTECPDWDWHNANPMSCSGAGKSPLAKTQYIRWRPKGRTDSCGNQARFLRCIKGCESKRVPKILEELPYECE